MAAAWIGAPVTVEQMMVDVVSAMPVFHEIAALLGLTAAIGLIGLLLRQPLIVTYIAVGIAAGPSVLGVARSDSHLALLSDLGIVLLLFLVGLKLDLRLVRSMGWVATATGLGQIVFTAVIGFGICLLLGLDLVASAYVSVALTFSSTIIVVKLLSDKREIASLHGQIALGFLIVQDIFVILAMLALSAIGIGATAKGHTAELWALLASVAAAVVFAGIFIRYVADRLTNMLARSTELLVCFAIGWAALFAAGADWLGIGKEMGGLLAGVTLASTRYREMLGARLASLRDFLLLFFFLVLGSRLNLGGLGEQIWPALVLATFVLIGNPVIVIAIMSAMGYRLRTGFLAGLTVAQISEFSLIFMAMGVTLGQVDESALGLVTIVGLVTIALCTYMIVHSHRLYDAMHPVLRRFEPANPYREKAADFVEAGQPHDAIIFGVGRFGGAIARRLTERGWRVLGVDFDPVNLERWRQRGMPMLFGDATDPEFINELPLEGVRWVVSAVPPDTAGLTHESPRYVLLTTLAERRFGGKIAVANQQPGLRAALLAQGADLVLEPFEDAADQAVDLLTGEGSLTSGESLQQAGP